MIEKMKRAIKSCESDLDIDGLKISCAVLNDETRVLVTRSVANVLGKKGAGAYWKKKKEEKGAALPEYVSARYLRPFISSELRKKLTTPTVYINNKGFVTEGIDATILPEICDVWIKFREKGTSLTPKREEIARRAYILLRGFATVGIIALVDEATGFQKIRDRFTLQKILAKFLRDEKLAWAKKFPDEFYIEIFRLRGWEWKGMRVNRPQYLGKITNEIVYERLAPGLLEELKQRTPRDEKGNTQFRFHQWFTEDFGNPKLLAHLYALVALLKISPNWQRFISSVRRAFPKTGDQGELDF